MYFPVSVETIVKTGEHVVDAIAIKNGALFVTITTDTVTLWHAETVLFLDSFRRVTDSLESVGLNSKLYIRPDNKLLAIQSTLNVLLLFDICEDANPDKRPYESDDFPGTPCVWLQHKRNIRVEAGIQAVCLTENELVLSTRKPAMIQTLPWGGSGGQQPEPQTAMLSKLPFLLHVTGGITRVNEIKSVGSSVALLWLTNNGEVYLAWQSDKWHGCLVQEHNTDDPILRLMSLEQNAYSLVSVSGHIYTYELSRYEKGYKPGRRKHFIVETAKAAIRYADWCPGGNALLIVLNNAWAIYSRLGSPLCHQSIGPGDSDHLRMGIWLAQSQRLLFVPMQSANFSVLEYIHACAPSSAALHTRAYLRNLDRASVRHLMPDSTDPEIPNVLLQKGMRWLHHPVSPRIEYGPLLYAGFSTDGLLSALAYKQGLVIHDLMADSWTQFTDLEEALSIRVMCDPIWYKQLAVVGLCFEDDFEIRVFSQAYPLEQDLCSFQLKSSPLRLILHNSLIYVVLKDSLLALKLLRTQDNTIILKFEAQYGLPELDLQPNGRYSILMHGTSLGLPYFLVEDQTDLVLVDFIEEEETGPKIRRIISNVEWHCVLHGVGPLKNALVTYDGHKLAVYLNILMSSSLDACFTIPIEFWPVDVDLETGLVEGLRSTSRKVEDVVFWSTEDASLNLLPDILYALVCSEHLGDTLVISSRYANQPQFPAVLEVVLFRTLERELEKNDGILQKLKFLLQNYEKILPIIVVGCARKVEVSSWSKLFDALGNPFDFYHASIAADDLNTAGAYLLVLHTLDTTLDHETYTLDVLKRAIDAEEWSLAEEVARFYSVVAEDPGKAVDRMQKMLAG